MPASNMMDSFKGCLLAGASGDALGAPVEFFSPQSILNLYGKEGIRDLDESYDVAGAITDDTQMSLFTAEACIQFALSAESKSPYLLENWIKKAYERWFNTQVRSDNRAIEANGYLASLPELNNRRGPGNTCMTALSQGAPVVNSKGCGGVMRVAPIGLFLSGRVDLKTIFDIGNRSSRITHGHPTGYLAAGFLAATIASLLEGRELLETLDYVSSLLKEYDQHGEVLKIVQTAVSLSTQNVSAPEAFNVLGQGWVAEEALAIAVYACLSRESLEEAVIFAVNHGGDSDSTGSITGHIKGVIKGYDAIPARWVEKLELHETIMKVAENLYWAKTGEQEYKLNEIYGKIDQ